LQYILLVVIRVQFLTLRKTKKSSNASIALKPSLVLCYLVKLRAHSVPTSLMDQQPVHLPEQEINAEAFREHVNANPTGAFEQWQRMQQQAHQATALPSTQPTLDPQTMATIVQLVATTLQNQSQSIRLDTPAPSSPTTASTIHRSEKLPDTPEYDGDRDRLDAWEQSLIQRMHVNHDRYPTDREKIAYAESRLTIGKKAHNLMGQYRRDGLCYLTSFVDWRQKLRHLCGNPFEAEDARTYTRDTHKQGSTSFAEYYHLFCQKKERSRMDDASLVDCLKRNVNYATQLAAFSWRNSEENDPLVSMNTLKPSPKSTRNYNNLNTDNLVRQPLALLP
ncbi:MAG: hypothetical protein L6R37_008469, partial [Teloschistes peruensis]